MGKVVPISTDELHDDMAERCLLGRLFIENPYYLEIHDELDPEDFYSERHKQIYVAFQAAYLKRGKVELADVLEALNAEGQGPHITYLSECADDAYIYRSVDHPLRKVLKLSNKRRLKYGLMRIERDIEGKEESEVAEELIALAVDTRRAKGRVFSGEELADLAYDLMERRRERSDLIQGFRTGFKTVDFHTGGLQGKRVTVIAGPTGHGKSGLAINWMVHLCIRQRIPGLFITVEMREQDVLDRAVAILSGQELRAIEGGVESPLIAEAHDQIRASPFHVTDNAPKTIHDVSMLIEKFAMLHGIKVWCLDYIGRLDQDRLKDEARDERFQRYVKLLWNVTQRSDLHGIIVSQVNAQEVIAESRKIEHECDCCFFFKREDGKHTLECRKNRFGPVGYRYKVYYNRANQRMREDGSDEKDKE